MLLPTSLELTVLSPKLQNGSWRSDAATESNVIKKEKKRRRRKKGRKPIHQTRLSGMSKLVQTKHKSPNPSGWN